MERKFIDVNEAYEHHDLACWYQSSVDDTPPIWTDEHLEELLNDFYVIPKDTHTTVDVTIVRHGHWIAIDNTYYCSECNIENGYAFSESTNSFTDYFCPNCGAKMDGERKQKNER